jgi:hypothetical protein
MVATVKTGMAWHAAPRACDGQAVCYAPGQQGSTPGGRHTLEALQVGIVVCGSLPVGLAGVDERLNCTCLRESRQSFVREVFVREPSCATSSAAQVFGGSAHQAVGAGGNLWVDSGGDPHIPEHARANQKEEEHSRLDGN